MADIKPWSSPKNITTTRTEIIRFWSEISTVFDENKIRLHFLVLKNIEKAHKNKISNWLNVLKFREGLIKLI